MNDYLNPDINPVAIATSVLLLVDQHRAARYRLENAAAMIACLDRDFAGELRWRVAEARRGIISEMLQRS